MGVTGLWEIINKTGISRSVANLAFVDGFENNHNGTRTLQVGIDASLWLHHASQSFRGKDDSVGAHPELRVLFFRLAKFSKLPISLIFVFDGRERPKVKRGSKKGKSGSHNLAPGFRQLIRLFGMDAREARGEAEAELAYLNMTGAIDAIISDDVDTFVFGARMILKNFSLNLSGNKAEPPEDFNGKVSGHHANVYTAEAIARHPDVQLTRGGLLLLAILAGGDYNEGLRNCGVQKAHALARLGFGDRLLAGYENRHAHNFDVFLHTWRIDLENELRTNASRRMPRASPNFTVPANFPSMQTLQMYIEPLTSATNGGTGGGPPRHNLPIDLPGLAQFCEKHFIEWGARSHILKRFSTIMTQGLVTKVLVAAALEADRREQDRRLAERWRPEDICVTGVLPLAPGQDVGTSATLVRRWLMPKKGVARDERMDRIAAAFVNRGSLGREAVEAEDMEEDVEDRHPLIVRITRTREHVSTDFMLEYRVEVCPRQLVEITDSGIKGLHPDTSGAGRTRAGIDNSDDEGDDDDGGRDKKQDAKDPNANILLWVPASIMRQVHPGVVEEYEEKQRQRQAKTSSKKNRGNEGSTVRPTVARTDKGKGKGKEKSRAHTDTDVNQEYLDANPHASFAAPKDAIIVFAGSSLPFRRCGFNFTWPDPDDPDRLVVDTDDRDDLPTTVVYGGIDTVGGPVFRQYDTAAHVATDSSTAPATSATTASTSKVQAKETSKGKSRSERTEGRKRKRSPAHEGEEDDDEPWVEPEAAGRFSQFNNEIDRILGIGVDGAMIQREKAKRRKKPRASALTDDRSRTSKGKERAIGEGPRQLATRRRTAHGAANTQDAPHAPERRQIVEGSSQLMRRLEHSQIDEMIRSRSCSPARRPIATSACQPSIRRTASSSTPPPPTVSLPTASCSVRKRHGPVHDDDVVDISSDSHDEAVDETEHDWRRDAIFSLAPFNGQRSRFSQRKASEHQHPFSRAAASPSGEAEDDPDTMEDGSRAAGTNMRSSAGGQKASSGAGCASSSTSSASQARRTLRHVPIPSSSQESALDDGDGFFRGVSAVKNLY